MENIYSTKYNSFVDWRKKDTNVRHREDGPAVEYTDGSKCWYQNGKYHRIDGPAVEFSDGEKRWYYYGLRHRTDGPAVEYSYGYKEYWLNGIYYENIKTDEEWIIFQIIN